MREYSDSLAILVGIALAGVVSFVAYILVFGDYNGDSGGLKQKPGRAACVSIDGTGGFSDGSDKGDCAVARAVGLPTALVLSPDATNAYVAAHREAVVALDRDARTGALSAVTGTGGCVSRDGTPGGERARRLRQPAAVSTERSCAVGRGLFGVTDVAVSPDGRNVYVASADGLAIFDRDEQGGALTQKAGEAGCITRTGLQRGATRRTPGCARARGMLQASSVTVSPDGRSVYVTSVDVLAFARDPRSGTLTQIAGPGGCVAATSKGADGADCRADPEADGATSLFVTPDGRQLLATSGTEAGGAGAVAILARDRASGALAPIAGPAGCITQGACTSARGLRGAAAVAMTEDGRSVYVLSDLGCTIGVYDRDPASGQLAQKPGPAGSVDTHADHGACNNSVSGARAGFTGGGIALSPDGGRLFVTARAGLAMYSRRARGTLQYDGCVSDDGEGTCDDVKALNVPISPVVSRDGRDLYVGVQGGDAIGAFTIPRRAAST